MKIFSFIFSLAAFVVTAYFLFSDFPSLSTTEGIIYFSMVVVLLLICITGIISNRPTFTRTHYKGRRYSIR